MPVIEIVAPRRDDSVTRIVCEIFLLWGGGGGGGRAGIRSEFY